MAFGVCANAPASTDVRFESLTVMCVTDVSPVKVLFPAVLRVIVGTIGGLDDVIFYPGGDIVVSRELEGNTQRADFLQPDANPS